MKTIEETLLNRTSVRRYEYDKIPSETLDFIYRAIANTPTSYNGATILSNSYRRSIH